MDDNTLAPILVEIQETVAVVSRKGRLLLLRISATKWTRRLSG